MSFPDKPRPPRSARRARPRISLKMQAIGFLSRREHSRQELRLKLLESLRKRAREDATLEAAAEDLRQAALAQPSNGIDDAFAPRAPALAPADGRAPGPRAGARAHEDERQSERSPGRPSSSRDALDTLTLATGAALPLRLRARLQPVADPSVIDVPSARRSGPAPAAHPPGEAQDGAHPPGDTEDGADPLGEAQAGTDPPDEAPDGADPPGGPAGEALDDADLERTDPEAAVDRLLDWLVANKYLSDTRFVESRVNARSRKQGTLRIRLELSRHGLALEPEQAAALRETEFARARDLWQRKFGEVAADPKQRAKQARFLAARGFAADVVRRVVGGLDED
ncbi:MAG: RecX family transcriptional regulator [Burkholderiales bacterium]|nr:RecX family transcriptional regulator [Burkholderiales bacterium]